MKLFSKSTMARILPILSVAALSGCGPNLITSDQPANEMGTNAYSIGQTDNPDYICTGANDILPTDDRVMDGTQHYEACPNRASATKILINGYSSTSRMICAFPVQYLNNTQFIYRLNSQGLPLSQCFDGWSPDNTAEIDFPSTAFNGVLIVDQGSAGLMASCLVGGQTCPVYSIGRFR